MSESHKVYASQEYVDNKVSDFEEYVNSIALPPVTAENNGAILQVIDGKWTAVQATASVNETGGLTFNIGG